MVSAAQLTPAAFPEFYVGNHPLFSEQSFDALQQLYDAQPRIPAPAAASASAISSPSEMRAAPSRPIPTFGRFSTPRTVPGFDINGNGFVGVPSAARGTTAPNAAQAADAAAALTQGDDLSETVAYADLASPTAPSLRL